MQYDEAMCFETLVQELPEGYSEGSMPSMSLKLAKEPARMLAGKSKLFTSEVSWKSTSGVQVSTGGTSQG